MTANESRGAGRVGAVLSRLERIGKPSVVAGMARYGIEAKKAFGVAMGQLLRLAQELGPDHALATALWASGWYEARLLASLIGEPERVTARQMDAWAKSFESWADCDTVCFKLWDRSPLAWAKAVEWASAKQPLVKRGAFALMACLALHDKETPDARFRPFLPLVERAATDDHNFVKKGVSWALRSIGRRSPALRAAALELAGRLASAPDAAARWVGRDVIRDLEKAGSRKAGTKKSESKKPESKKTGKSAKRARRAQPGRPAASRKVRST